MGFSDYLENQVLDNVLASGGWIALSTANPLDDGSGLTEPDTGDGYSRVEVLDWDAAASGQKPNTNPIEFPEATASWGTITHFAILDSSSGGNILIHGPLTVAKAIGAGDIPRFAPGDLVITLD